MKISKIIPFLLLSLTIAGCGQTPAPEDPSGPDKGSVNVQLVGISKTTRTEPYILSFNYDNSYFDHSATKYDQNLMMLSLGSAYATDSGAHGVAFFEKMYFADTTYKGYDFITADTIGFFISHKVLEDADLYAISVRGLNYGPEWANNFMIGETGNHAGFTEKAEEIFSDFQIYRNDHHEKGTYKVWLTGYSRGGGVANVLADKFMREGMNKDNLFVYTFEAPQGIIEENYVAYQNVFNMVDSRDLIPYVAPSEYGFCRCGIDIDIYSENYRTYALEFDPGIEFNTFTPDSGASPKYTDELSFLEHFIEELLKEYIPEEGSERLAPGDLSTREHFYEYYQPNIAYLFEFIMSLTEEQMNGLMEYIQENMAMLFFMLSSATDAFYQAIKPKLIELGVTYDEEKLTNATIQIGCMIQAHLSLVTEMLDGTSVNQKMVDNIMCVVTHHYPEIVYCSAKNFVYSN